MRFLGERKEWRSPCLLYPDYLVLCGELKEDLKAMVGCFAEVYKRRGLKVNADKSTVMMFNGKEKRDWSVRFL